jgi:hypothetical protein
MIEHFFLRAEDFFQNGQTEHEFCMYLKQVNNAPAFNLWKGISTARNDLD